jgi:hypothetical protein
VVGVVDVELVLLPLFCDGDAVNDPLPLALPLAEPDGAGWDTVTVNTTADVVVLIWWFES